MKPAISSCSATCRSSGSTFQTRRQIDLYRAAPASSPTAIPAGLESLLVRARARLSPEIFEWINGGAGSGQTIQNNLHAFRHWQIVPRMLCDVSQRNLSIELFGRTYPSPLLIAPIGVQALLHPEGEVATARAAASVGIPFVLSSVSSMAMEHVAQAMEGADRWFQLYWSRDPNLTLSFLNRAEIAGYSAIVVTLDTQTLGWRERNLDHAYLPFLHGQGLGNYVTDPVFRAGLPEGNDELTAVVEHYLSVFSNLSHTWNDLTFLRTNTRLPLLVKGIQHPEDALKSLDHGVDGIIVSNHGGRQVDGAIGALDALPSILRAVSGRVPVLLDSGVRRGVDVFKALALGADAVLVGRPCMWALAIGGEAGVREFLWNLLADLDVTFALCGKRSVADIGKSDLVRTDRSVDD